MSSLQADPLETSGNDEIALGFGLLAPDAHVGLTKVFEVLVQDGLPPSAKVGIAAKTRENVFLHHGLIADRALDLVPADIAAKEAYCNLIKTDSHNRETHSFHWRFTM